MKTFIKTPSRDRNILVGCFVALFAVVGTFLLLGSHAATTNPYVSTASSSGTLSGNATFQQDSSAAGGKYVKFGSPASTGGGGGGGGGTGSLVVGMNAGNRWYPRKLGDITSAVSYVRFSDENPAPITNLVDGTSLKAVFMIHGSTNGTGSQYISGVSAIDPNTFATNAVKEYQHFGCTPTLCPWVEILNEPAGNWFWGSYNLSNDAPAYAAMIQPTKQAFANAYPSSTPKLLWSYDGGQSSSTAWGDKWWSSSVAPYVDAVTMHPYAHGTPNGNRGNVQYVINKTGKPVYITEVGWPTGPGATGDSDPWSLQQQCNNVQSFISWARATSGVAGVFYYDYINDSDSDNRQYGLITHDNGNLHKPAYYGYQAAAQGKSYTCGNSLLP
ncbi:MAG TPA: glycosyl hydrolase [Candidatus Saccharimonadales bacterium]